jgi:hypothetical protein
VYDEEVGTIKAPNYPNNNGKLDGCFDIMAKVRPATAGLASYFTPDSYAG